MKLKSIAYFKAGAVSGTVIASAAEAAWDLGATRNPRRLVAVFYSKGHRFTPKAFNVSAVSPIDVGSFLAG